MWKYRHAASTPIDGCSERQTRQRVSGNEAGRNATIESGRRALDEMPRESLEVSAAMGEGNSTQAIDSGADVAQQRATDERMQRQEEHRKLQRRLAEMYAKHVQEQWQSYPAAKDGEAPTEYDGFGDEETARLLGFDPPVHIVAAQLKQKPRRQVRKMKTMWEPAIKGYGAGQRSADWSAKTRPNPP